MSYVIFRTINGIVRPFTVGNSSAKSKVKKSTVESDYNLKKNHYRDFRSFTVPNVECKTCGQRVYYYEHPSGSRVLFDALGPPWPLHPCFISGQNAKNKLAKPIGDVAAKKEKGWLPVVIDHVQLQVDRIEVRARTEKEELLFTIKASTLKSRKIHVNQVKNLLVLIKRQSGTVVRVQLHDGKSGWEQNGVLQHLNSKQSATLAPMVLSEKKFKSLTPLQNGRIVIENERLRFDFLFYGKKYHQSIGGNQWHTLRHKLDRLKLYFGKNKMEDKIIIYALDLVTREFINFTIKGEDTPELSTIPDNSDKRVLLEDIYLEDVESQRIKLLGKIDDSYITFYMSRRYLRADENIDVLLDGGITLWLEHAEGAECHLYVETASRKKTIRGKVTILSCMKSSQIQLPESTDFIVENIDLRKEEHLLLSVTSKRKRWEMQLFVSDFQRNYLLNRFDSAAEVPLRQRRNTKKISQVFTLKTDV
ncbi:hypothetical protein K5E19_13305 [Enterobacter sp. RIT637]|uniref:hypothetical protein n=1 Tax=Enterobacter sp. RIT637 TaxID=2870470 RepID=UPI001C874D8D|nr:hypothetical protein [Enterobacter sp. RIT637]MBX8461419.1 hypothetical protein [Enterobacter sp. RIT637]